MGFVSDIIGGVTGGSESSTPTNYGSLPGFLQTGIQDIYNFGMDIGGSTAPFEALPTQQALLGMVQPFNPQFNLGQRSLATYDQAGQFTPQISDFLGSGGQFLNQARGGIGAGSAPITSGEIGSSIADFMNPYESQVIGNLGSDLSRFGQGLQSDIFSRATDAGAFGGSRQAITEGELGRNLIDRFLNTAGGLRQQGFQNASSLGLNRLQTDRSRALQGAQTALSGAGMAGNLAGQATGAYGTMAGVGSDLMRNRLGVEQMRQGSINNAIAAQEMMRDPRLRQFAFQQGVINPFLQTLPGGGQQSEQSGGIGGFLGGALKGFGFGG